MKVVVILIIMLLPIAAYAQEGHSGKIDIEGGINASYRAHHRQYVGFGFHFEGRYQLKKAPVDVGLRLGAMLIATKNYRESSVGDSEGGVGVALPVMLVSDYQFGRGRKVNPFVGLGCGAFFVWHGLYNPFLMPRIGVRWFKSCSTSFSYTIAGDNLSGLNFHLGFYF